MNNKIIIAGIGPGSVEYISPAALNAIKSSNILVGGQRALSQFANDHQVTFPITGDIKSAVDFIRDKLLTDNVCVMVSGDPGYYSMLSVIRKNFPAQTIKVIPSISAIQLAFAKLVLSWHNATLLSFHGRRPTDEELRFAENKIIGMLTDGKFNSHTIPEILMSNGWRGDTKLVICHRLSYEDEQIIQTTLAEAAQIDVFKHCILIVGDF